MNYLDYVVPNVLGKNRIFKCRCAAWKYRKATRFAYITVPEHVVKELLKLYGIEFNGRKLVIKKAKTPPKKPTGKNKQACPKS